jgi:hypothetical protein
MTTSVKIAVSLPIDVARRARQPVSMGRAASVSAYVAAAFGGADEARRADIGW